MKNLVLLHGLFCNKLVMKPIEFYFTRKGYRVLNISYRIRRSSISEIGDRVRSEISKVFKGETVNFVGHSLGGLIARSVLSKDCDFEEGIVITLGTPHAGSMLMKNVFPFNIGLKLYFGQLVDDLKWQSDCVKNLKMPNVLHIVIGNNSVSKFNLFYFLNEFYLQSGNAYTDGIVREIENFPISNRLFSVHHVEANHQSMLVSKHVIKILRNLL